MQFSGLNYTFVIQQFERLCVWCRGETYVSSEYIGQILIFFKTQSRNKAERSRTYEFSIWWFKLLSWLSVGYPTLVSTEKPLKMEHERDYSDGETEKKHDSPSEVCMQKLFFD